MAAGPSATTDTAAGLPGLLAGNQPYSHILMGFLARCSGRLFIFEMQKLPSHQALAAPLQTPCEKLQRPGHRLACDSLTALDWGAELAVVAAFAGETEQHCQLLVTKGVFITGAVTAVRMPHLFTKR